MRYWEILLFCLGLSLDVFAVAVCHGAVLGKIRPGRLCIACLIFCAAQTAALELGRLLARFPRLAAAYSQHETLWHTLAAGIFFLLAAYLAVKAVRRREVFEHRSELLYKNVLLTAGITSLDALLVGISSGFLNAFWASSLATLFVVTGVCAALGVAMGYFFGYRQKTAAYWIGGALFLAAGVDVFARYLF
ncbi:MAG: manganese efflux pump [Oscillospiraceae bacterium]|nr:manganese efflux pump [Oscillospiraceae bacterium]